MAHNKVPDIAKVPDTAKVSDTAKVPDTAKILDTVREPDISRGVDIVQAYKSLHGLKTLKVPKILFFDSGMGGLSVLSEVRKLNPGAAYYYLFDHEGFPYGQKSESYLVARVETLLSRVSAVLAPDLIVIACNTASTVVLDQIRPHFSRIPIVGVVPAIKTAGQLSHKRKIALLATPGTVKRAYIDFLINEFAYDCKVQRVGTEDLVRLAESALLNACKAHDTLIGSGFKYCSREALERVLEPITSLRVEEKPDTVVLGCTHFPLLREQICAILGPEVTLVDSGEAIGRRVQTILQRLAADVAHKDEREEHDEHEPQRALSSVQPAQSEPTGAQIAFYTGQVTPEDQERFSSTFAHFGFDRVQPMVRKGSSCC